MDEAQAAGAWVKSQRLASGMTQEQLAGKSGLSVRAISNLERGRTEQSRKAWQELLDDKKNPMPAMSRYIFGQEAAKTPAPGED